MLPDGAADLTRCIGSARIARVSTMLPWELSANAWKGTVAT